MLINLSKLKCNLITGITEINHKLKVKYVIMFLFLLGSTLSISISPILAASDIDNDGILNCDESIGNGTLDISVPNTPKIIIGSSINNGPIGMVTKSSGNDFSNSLYTFCGNALSTAT